MNALFMPFAPLVSGRICAGLDARRTRTIVRALVTQSLTAQINDIVTTEAGLIEKLKQSSVHFKSVRQLRRRRRRSRSSTPCGWPRPRRFRELRKIGATL